MIDQNISEINKLMDIYFTGLHQADSHVLRPIFHPDLSYTGLEDGNSFTLNFEQYMARIKTRTSPQKQGEPLNGEVLEIAIGNDHLARVTAHMNMLGRNYLDYLTLIRNDNEAWRIISKVFTQTSSIKE